MPGVWRLIWPVYSGSPTRVEDVLHDVMLGVWQRAPAYQPTGRVSTWIFWIAKYRVLKARASLVRQYPARLHTLPNAPEEEPLDEGLIRQERKRAVAALLAALRPEQRAVVERLLATRCVEA